MVQQTVLVAVGGDATLECQAKGIPSPLVHWFKGKVKLSMYMNITVRMSMVKTSSFVCFVFAGELEVGSAPFVEQDERRGTLHIRGVQEVDAGQYSCVASSPAGTSSGTVSVEVGGESVCILKCYKKSIFFSFFLPFKQRKIWLFITLPSTAGPLFSEAPVDVTANVGENITLPCVARGYPQPTVTWRKQDGRQILTRTESHSRTILLENGLLLIQSELFIEHYHNTELWSALLANTTSWLPFTDWHD